MEDMEEDDEEGSQDKTKKVYKIKYQVNLLPMVGAYYYKNNNLYTGESTSYIMNEEINLLEVLCAHCGDEDAIDIFTTQTILDMMNFKWDNFAFKFHVFGLVYHLFYIVILFAYTFVVYIHPSFGTSHEHDADGTDSAEWKQPVTHRDYVIVLLVGISYPFFYEFN